MARHSSKPEHPDTLPPASTHPSADCRCDRSNVERARWHLVSPITGRTLALCNYHYRQHEVQLAIDGWSAIKIKEEDDS